LLNGNGEIAHARPNGHGTGIGNGVATGVVGDWRGQAATVGEEPDVETAGVASDDHDFVARVLAGRNVVGPGGWRGWPNREAAVAAARKLVENTTRPQAEIARHVGISPRALSDWKCEGNWTRPAGAPEAPQVGGANAGTAADRKDKLVTRLFGVFDRQLMDIESRARTPGATTEEKDARVLGTLARTLGTLMALGRGDGDQPDDPEAEAVDPDEIRARIAQRLFGMAKGGTEL
jgi:hypothetical protein